MAEKTETSEEQLEKLKKQLADAAQANAELQAELQKATLKNQTGGKPIVMIEESTYKIMSGAIIGDKTYTAQEIAKDEELAKSLILKGSDLVQLITDQEDSQ